MKNLYKSVVLSMALAVPMVSGAATVTNSFNIGTFPGVSSSINDGTAGAVGGNLKLPGAGSSFIDNFAFTIAPGGTSQGSANISLTGVSVQNIPDIAASISTVGPLGVVLDIPSLKVLNLASIGALAAGNYIFSVTGTVSAVEASYSGNIQLSGASSVPVPAAVWLFGSALVGLMGVSGRKKKTLS